jgi:pyruvate kinase
MKRCEVTEDLIHAAAARVRELDWVKSGERVGITVGMPSGRPGPTSLLQIQEV